MGREIEGLVSDVASAGRVGDRERFGAATAVLRVRLLAQRTGSSIGPKMAFGTLRPAGDAVGKALVEAPLQEALACIDLMAHDESAEIRSIACQCLARVGVIHPEAIVPLARHLAADSSWEVREFIANALDEVMGQDQGDFVYQVMRQWVHDPDPNVRRVPTNALMRYGRRYPDRIIALMKELLHDDSRYVRDNVVFCLGVMGAIKVQAIGSASDPDNPQRLLAALRQWIEDDNEHTRWIIAKTLGRSWAKSCGQDAMAMLDILSADERRGVRQAVASSIKALQASAPGLVRTATVGMALPDKPAP